jgi:ADP-heptose:LPS heptosyltransferase
MEIHGRWNRLRREFEHRVRGGLLRVLRLCWKPDGRDFDAAGLRAASSKISKILIARTSHNLGDVVMVSAVVDECRRLFPNATLTLLVHGRITELFRGRPGLDELLQLHPRWFLRPIAAVRLICKLRRSRFDLALDCANPGAPSLNNWLLTRLTDATWRVGFREAESRTFLNVLVDAQPNTHFISNQLRLLAPFVRPDKFRLPQVVLADKEIQKARESLKRGLPQDIAQTPCVMIFVPEPQSKCWPLPVFVELTERLCREGVNAFLCFGPRDAQRDSPAVQELAARWPKRIRVLPPLRLREFAALMTQCNVFLSNDCGPMHLAVAAGAPTVAVFLLANKDIHGYDDGRRHFVITGSTDEERLSKTVETTRAFLAVGLGADGGRASRRAECEQRGSAGASPSTEGAT